MPRLRWILILGVGLGLLLYMAPTFRCVVEGTPIDTPYGPRFIEDLKVGDVVWSRDVQGELSTSIVSAVECSFTLRYLRFVLADGRRLEVTASHPLATQAGWTQAGRVSSSETVSARLGPVVVADVVSAISWKAVYDLSVEPHANFFANGVLVHNKSVHNRESQAIGDTRSVVSAMQTYASANCGLYPSALTDATRDDGTPIAIPNFPEDVPDFFKSDIGRPSPYVKYGYRRTYQTFGRPDVIPSECAADSVLDYCYSSHPVRPFRYQWLNEHPRLAEILPVDFLRYRSFVATSDGYIYTDRKGRDSSCIDGKPPDYAILLE